MTSSLSSSRHGGSVEEIRALEAFIKLSQAADSLGATLQQSIGELGLTPWQVWVLGTVLECEPVSAREVRWTLHGGDSNMTAVLDRLEEC